MSEINVFRITPEESLPFATQADTFDEVTRQLPQGFYTTFRTYNGCKRVLGLKAHLQRLYKPAILQEIKPSVSPEDLRKKMVGVLHGFTGEARVRLVMSRSGDIFLALAPLSRLPEEVYQNGVMVITTDVQRESPRLKSTEFISKSEDVRTQISGNQIFEALLLRKNLILEGVTSNFFYIKDGLLGTAQKDVLLGITRRTVLQVGRGIGLEIDYRPLHKEQIVTLDEAFLTSSSRGIVPIVQINNFRVGLGVPGAITKKLLEAFNAYVARHTEII